MSARVSTWMPFYVGDYLRDTGRLTTEGHGAYLLLILDYWSSGGPLPDDDEQLAAIARLPAERWQKLKQVLSAYFTVADGLWKHGRIDAELAKATAISKSRQEAGKRGASAKANARNSASAAANDSANATANDKQPDQQNATQSQSPSPTYSEDKSSGAAAPPPAGDVSRETDPWKKIYDGLKRHLGTKSGGLISKLRQVSGEAEMANWLDACDRGEIADAREYFGKIIAGREGKASPTDKPDPEKAFRQKAQMVAKGIRSKEMYSMQELDRMIHEGLVTQEQAKVFGWKDPFDIPANLRKATLTSRSETEGRA